MDIYIIIILCIIFYLLCIMGKTEGFYGEPVDINNYSKIINKDQDGQTISKYTLGEKDKCISDCNNNNKCDGMVIDNSSCWTINSFPSPINRTGSTTYKKTGSCSTGALCNSTINTRTSERDNCNTALNGRTSERDTCNTALKDRINERDVCLGEQTGYNKVINARIVAQEKCESERETCNKDLNICQTKYNNESSYFNDLILLQKKYSSIYQNIQPVKTTQPVLAGDAVQTTQPVRTTQPVLAGDAVQTTQLFNFGNLTADGQATQAVNFATDGQATQAVNFATDVYTK